MQASPPCIAARASPSAVRSCFGHHLLWFYLLWLCLLWQVCVSFVFRSFIVTIILGNTLTTSVDNPYLSATRRAQLELINMLFGWLFLLEAAIKLFALGRRQYARSYLNLLDGALVLIFLANFTLGLVGVNTLSHAQSAMRSFRALRIFTLMATHRHLTPIP